MNQVLKEGSLTFLGSSIYRLQLLSLLFSNSCERPFCMVGAIFLAALSLSGGQAVCRARRSRLGRGPALSGVPWGRPRGAPGWPRVPCGSSHPGVTPGACSEASRGGSKLAPEAPRDPLQPGVTAGQPRGGGSSCPGFTVTGRVVNGGGSRPPPIYSPTGRGSGISCPAVHLGNPKRMAQLEATRPQRTFLQGTCRGMMPIMDPSGRP